MLSQLIYVSEIAEPHPDRVAGILQAARDRNAAHGVTGVLYFNGSYFLQCLEGRRKAVTDTFCRIAADTRHTDVTLLSFCDVDERDFGDWTMAYIVAKPALEEVLRRYLVTVPFTPDSLTTTTSAAIIKTMQALGDTAYHELSAYHQLSA